MKYTQQDVFRIASQIDDISDEADNCEYIKLKKGVDANKFKQDLVSLGIPEEHIENDTLVYTHIHKDYTWSVLARPGALWSKTADFLYAVEKQLKRIKILDELHRNGGALLNQEEVKYLQKLATQDAAMAMKSKTNG